MNSTTSPTASFGWRPITFETAYQGGVAFCEIAHAVNYQVFRNFDAGEPVSFDFGPARKAVQQALADYEVARSREPQSVDGAIGAFFSVLLDVVADLEGRLTPERIAPTLAMLPGEADRPFSLWSVVATDRYRGYAQETREILDVFRIYDDMQRLFPSALCESLGTACEPATCAFLMGYILNSQFHFSVLGDSTIEMASRRWALAPQLRLNNENWDMDNSPLLVDLKQRLQACHIAAIVKHYIANRRRYRPEHERFAAMPDLDTAVAAAISATDERGKRYHHQRRLSRATLDEDGERIADLDLSDCESFDDLHDRIEAATHGVYRFGPLAVYDTAVRIGAFLGLEPERVYVHTGAEKGARVIGLGKHRKTLEIEELPREFHVLSGSEIEDCLCVYKDQLREIYEQRRRR